MFLARPPCRRGAQAFDGRSAQKFGGKRKFLWPSCKSLIFHKTDEGIFGTIWRKTPQIWKCLAWACKGLQEPRSGEGGGALSRAHALPIAWGAPRAVRPAPLPLSRASTGVRDSRAPRSAGWGRRGGRAVLPGRGGRAKGRRTTPVLRRASREKGCAAAASKSRPRGAPYRNGSARAISSSRPGSLGLRGLPGWMIETWQFSAASTSWR